MIRSNMQYDPIKLRELRDNIDRVLAKDNQDEQRVYESLERGIGRAVAESMKPLMDELKSYLDKKTDKPE